MRRRDFICVLVRADAGERVFYAVHVSKFAFYKLTNKFERICV